MAKPGTKKADAVQRAIRVGNLVDLYGPLLTERQREFVRLHYMEDLSFGEIAKEYGVSRQAIHDAVKHAENSLNEIDAKLQLTPEMKESRLQAAQDSPGEEASPNNASSAPFNPGATVDGKVLEDLQSLHDRIARSGGVIYNGNEIAAELGQLIERLRGS